MLCVARERPCGRRESRPTASATKQRRGIRESWTSYRNRSDDDTRRASRPRASWGNSPNSLSNPATIPPEAREPATTSEIPGRMSGVGRCAEAATRRSMRRVDQSDYLAPTGRRRSHPVAAAMSGDHP
jgi:hypothetical protein